jgi:aminomethyltransferase
MVVNGATKAKDMAHFDAALQSFGGDVQYEHLAGQNLVALQGPGAAAALPRLLSAADAAALPKLAFMHGRRMAVLGVDCIVTRCGYTGEDGFEVSMPAADAVRITRALLEQPEVAPAGLGPRDSLRLEAGLCLYGHDIDDAVTPGEAVLGWTIGKRRRAAGGFLGADVILKQLNEKSAPRKRVGIAVEGAPARVGAVVYAAPAAGSGATPATATRVGVVTSGTFSPCLKAPVAMGYVAAHLAVEGTRLAIDVRGKLVPARVTKMPFVPHRYYKPAL